MDVHRAIEILKVHRKFIADINVDALVAHKMGIEALEKQIRKKLILKPFHDIMRQQACYDVNCVCGQNYMILEHKNDNDKGKRFKDFSETFEYCYKCGQKLDWN